MHANRIQAWKKRAKRRVFAAAIIATIGMGFGAVSLFGSDPQVLTAPSQLAKVPAARSVGIRVVNSNAAPVNNSTPAPAPNQSGVSFTLPPATVASPVVSAPALPLAPTLLPMTLPPALNGSDPLQAPPRMSEMTTKPSSGKVTVKLSEQTATPATGKSGMATTTAPTVGIQINTASNIKAPNSTQASVPAPFVMPKLPEPVASSNGTKTFLTTHNASEPSRENSQSVRIAVADKGADYKSIPSLPRTPEQIKPKPTQLSQSVSLAEAPSLDNSLGGKPAGKDDDNETLALLPPPVTTKEVPIASGLATKVQGSLSDQAMSPNASNRVSAKPVSTGGSAAFVSLAPPTLPLDQPSSKPASPEASASIVEPAPEASLSIGPTIKNPNASRPAIAATPVPVATGPKFDVRFASTAPVTTIELESQSAKALDVVGSIREIAVENEEVCRALHNGRTVSFVGNRAGTSLIQVWTKENKDAPQVLRVNVSQPWQKSNSKASDLDNVRLAVLEAFPMARLDILSHEDGTIEVKGETDSEETARRILETVRKLCLVPVKDKVRVAR